jgi:hypothetical protein
MSNPITAVQTWLWQVALKKGVMSLVKVIIAFITSVTVAPILKSLGIEIDTVTLTGTLTALITSGLTFVLNWIKVKFGIKWL